MPNKPSITCNHPGCTRLAIKHSYCLRHQGSGFQRNRNIQKLYNNDWHRESKAFLAEHPWCMDCLEQGVYEPATKVHHSVPHRGNHAIFWDKSKWRALSKRCHSKRTARGE